MRTAPPPPVGAPFWFFSFKTIQTSFLHLAHVPQASLDRSATPGASDDEDGAATVIWGTSIDTDAYTRRLRRFLIYYEDTNVDELPVGRGKYLQLLDQASSLLLCVFLSKVACLSCTVLVDCCHHWQHSLVGSACSCCTRQVRRQWL